MILILFGISLTSEKRVCAATYSVAHKSYSWSSCLEIWDFFHFSHLCRSVAITFTNVCRSI